MQNVDVKILYYDSNIVIVNKPGGLLAVPGRGPNKQDCVSTRLQKIFPQMIAQPSVHRLDMYTSGLMVYAIKKDVHRHLSMQFEARKVEKKYEALVEGLITQTRGEIQLPFRLDPENRPIQIYDPDKGKLGITLWAKKSEETNSTRIEFTPLTGRTHQLRVHAAHTRGLGRPIIGDSLYGSGKDGEQMMLHATLLRFTHPTSGETMQFFSQPPF